MLLRGNILNLLKTVNNRDYESKYIKITDGNSFQYFNQKYLSEISTYFRHLLCDLLLEYIYIQL